MRRQECVVAPTARRVRVRNGGGRDGVLPEQVPDQVVLADVGGEVIEARLLLLLRGHAGGAAGAGERGGGEQVQVRAAEHVGFADDAGGDGDGVDGRVEFGVRGREEELFQQTAPLSAPSPPTLLQCRVLVSGEILGWVGGVGHVYGERQLMHEFVSLPLPCGGLIARGFRVEAA